MRWIVVISQAAVLAVAAFAMFVISEQYPEYVPDRMLVNQLGFAFALCLLLMTVRTVVWADVKATAAIGFGLLALSVISGTFLKSENIGALVMLQSPHREGLSIAFSYAFLGFAFLYGGILLVKHSRE